MRVCTNLREPFDAEFLPLGSSSIAAQDKFAFRFFRVCIIVPWATERLNIFKESNICCISELKCFTKSLIPFFISRHIVFMSHNNTEHNIQQLITPTKIVDLYAIEVLFHMNDTVALKTHLSTLFRALALTFGALQPICPRNVYGH